MLRNIFENIKFDKKTPENDPYLLKKIWTKVEIWPKNHLFLEKYKKAKPNIKTFMRN